ncbi:hypothetical protein ACHAAC_17365 [Aeromicrobium sp. CF4.19]|uniref:hypothetical protein n=1 Tax=Aeromicrobium sp. CF4.19 TaxID=3373082 RepID=UPI003EE50D75
MQQRRLGTASVVSAATGVLLVVTAAVAAYVIGSDVRVHWPPLHAVWGPRFDARIVPAALLGVVLAISLPTLVQRLPWPGAVAATAGASWAWTLALALSDGPYGLGRVMERSSEYPTTARTVTDIPAMLAEFIDRIPTGAQDNWPIHVAGHPPGALLPFVWLDRLGVTSGFWIAMAVVTIGASAVAAVMLTIDELGDRDVARRAGPWLAMAPLVVWAGVSADWMFAAIGAWGLYLLARAGVRGSVPAALGAGALLGYCVFLSYGLVLLGVLALAVLWLARTWRPLPWAAGAALVVAGAFAVLGFAWWDAYPVLRERYQDGIASERPYGYWVWGSVAAWTFTAGVATWAAFPALWQRLRQTRHDAVAVLVTAGLITIALATLSGMSKAEVERIWLPFTVWVVAVGALLPSRWVRPLLLLQVTIAVVVQVLLITRW